jgi:hypothetical protein
MIPFLYLRWLPVCLLIFCGFSARAASIFLERKTLTADDFSIEYTAGDEDLARAFLVRLSETAPQASLANAAQPLLSLDSLRAERVVLLAAIGRHLAVETPDTAMEKVFADNLEFQCKLQVVAKAMRHFQLWRGQDLKARLKAGQLIPNVVRTRTGFEFKFASGPTTAPLTILWPIVITNRDTEKGEALITKKVREATALGGVSPSTRAVGRPSAVFFILHETAEMTIISHHLRSKDRRWFCDGVANYVTWKVIEERVGPVAARQYYDLQADLAEYAGVRDRIDLARWPAAENQGKLSAAMDRLDKASYPFATEVIAKVCARHGPDLLPKLFTEVDQTPFEKRTIGTVYRAFEKLTNEDLRSYFPERT